MGKVDLCIQTKRGVFSIPFKKWKNLDQFTISYGNKDELITALNGIFELSIDSNEIHKEDMYILYTRQYFNRGRRDTHVIVKTLSCFDFKYSSDNYDENDLMYVYQRYLKENFDRVRMSPIINVSTSAMINYKDFNMSLSEFDIDLAVKSYFANHQYRAKREIYYELKKCGYKVKIKPVIEKIKDTPNRDLSSFKTNDEYLDYLVQKLSSGDFDLDQIMDEISAYDMEELSGFRKLDGETTKSINRMDKLYELSELTGLSINELLEMAMNFSSKNKGRS